MTQREYTPGDRQDVLDLVIASWAPVFPKMKEAVPEFVYDAFYPKGWRARQIEDIGAALDQEKLIWVEERGGRIAGFMVLKLHPNDSMGEVYVIGVHPDFQRQGIGRSLLDFAFETCRQAGMKMVMVETGDDPGHAPSRASYEATGFERWPMARYFRKV